MKFFFRINWGIKFWDLSRGLRHWQPSSINVRMEFLFAFQFWYCDLCVKKRWVVAESIILLIFVLWGCFNCRWLKGGVVGQKVLFRASCYRIFCLLLRLKFQSARGASRHPAFMVLMMIKRVRRTRESKISFCYPRSLRASLGPTASEVA